MAGGIWLCLLGSGNMEFVENHLGTKHWHLIQDSSGSGGSGGGCCWGGGGGGEMTGIRWID